MNDNSGQFFEFEGFRLDPRNYSLWRGAELVSIPPKAMETLVLLVENHGEVVSREQLMETVWRETFVEEGNINYTISLLRKTLGGKNVIQTVPKRGYRFAAEVKIIEIEKNLLAQKATATVKGKPWVLVSIIFISFLSLSSLAFYWRADRPKPYPPKESSVSEAMQAYTRGRMILDKPTADKREEKAIDEFQRAVTLDPTFALAYAGLAEAFASTAVRLSDETGREYNAKAKTAAEKSLALDPNLAEGYSIRGWLKRNADWDWQGAENDLRRALDLKPESALEHYRLAHTLAPTGNLNEAKAEIEKAYALDPVSELVSTARFAILEARGEYDEGLELARVYARENKENPQAARALATFYLHKQLFPEIISTGEQTLSKTPARRPFGWISLLATAYLQTGDLNKADELLRELEKQAETNTKSLYSLAMNYAEQMRIDEAIAALEKCYDAREERMVWLNVEPRFANLKNDPRFRELLAKMNLQ